MLSFYGREEISPSGASMRNHFVEFKYDIVNNEETLTLEYIPEFKIVKLPNGDYAVRIKGRFDTTTDLMTITQLLLMMLNGATSIMTGPVTSWTGEYVTRDHSYPWSIREDSKDAVIDVDYTVVITNPTFNQFEQFVYKTYKSDSNAKDFDEVYAEIKKLFKVIHEIKYIPDVRAEIKRQYREMLESVPRDVAKYSVAMIGAYYDANPRDVSDEEKVEAIEKLKYLKLNNDIIYASFRLDIKEIQDVLHDMGITDVELKKCGRELGITRLY